MEVVMTRLSILINLIECRVVYQRLFNTSCNPLLAAFPVVLGGNLKPFRKVPLVLQSMTWSLSNRAA